MLHLDKAMEYHHDIMGLKALEASLGTELVGLEEEGLARVLPVGILWVEGGIDMTGMLVEGQKS